MYKSFIYDNNKKKILSKDFDEILKKLDLSYKDFCDLTTIPYTTLNFNRKKGRIPVEYIITLHSSLLNHYLEDLDRKRKALNVIFNIND